MSVFRFGSLKFQVLVQIVPDEYNVFVMYYFPFFCRAISVNRGESSNLCAVSLLLVYSPQCIVVF